MFTLIGVLVVIGAVLGGFTMAGGKIPALIHVSEIVVIVGTALGTVITSTPPATLKALTAKLLGLLKPTAYNKATYLEALKLLFELFQVARKDGLVAIEAHIEDPHKSALIKKYPRVASQHHAITFLCDSLRLVLVGGVPPYDLEVLMDNDIAVHHHEEAQTVSVLQRVSDSLPGIGIVAAVLGIVVTMGAIAGPVEQVGEHVAAALTGTFLGVLLAYGFAGPLATSVENKNVDESRFYEFLKASVVSFAKGFTPIVSVEFARRTIVSECRPSFADMEAACKALKNESRQARAA